MTNGREKSDFGIVAVKPANTVLPKIEAHLQKAQETQKAIAG